MGLANTFDGGGWSVMDVRLTAGRLRRHINSWSTLFDIEPVEEAEDDEENLED